MNSGFAYCSHRGVLWGACLHGESLRGRGEVPGTLPPHCNNRVVHFAVLYSSLCRIMNHLKIAFYSHRNRKDTVVEPKLVEGRDHVSL